MKAALKRLFKFTGHTVTKSNRWGIEFADDLVRVVGRNANTILDVGANRGQAAQRFLEAFPSAKVHSFEPLPAAFALLQKVGARYPGRLVAHPFALGDTEQTMTLNIAANDDGSSLLPFHEPGAHAWTRPAGLATVEVKRLDKVAHDLGIAHIDLLKIDTQGFDLHVMRGAADLLVPASVRAVVVELDFVPYYTGQASPAEIFDAMGARGYRPVGVYQGMRDKRGQMDWADCLFA